MSLPRLELREVIGTSSGRPAMTAIENDGDVRIVLRQLRQQYSQLLVRQIKTAGTATVVTDEPFVLAVRKEWPEGFGRFPAGAMAAVLKNRDVVSGGTTQVRTELLDNVSACRVCILE
jgi:hypothetical protein